MKLYQKKEKTFPSAVEIDGNLYCINADFKNILRIFAVLKDMKIPETKRVEKLIQWFFHGEGNIEISDESAVQSFTDFVNPPDENKIKSFSNTYDENNEDNELQFDYDFDAEEIYASFVSEYDTDLVDVDFLHWYKFKILLHSLSGESAFKKKIELRFMDLNGYSGQALADMTRAKESVQLPVEYSEDELRDREVFENIWGRL